MERLDYIAKHEARLTVSGAPAGYDAFLAIEAARRRNGPVLFVAADENEAEAALHAMAFFAPELRLSSFPAWDCLPYDRVSPKPDIESTRLATLAYLAGKAALAKGVEACVIVTSVNAVLQRVPPRDAIAIASFQARVGEEVDRDALVSFLAANGGHRLAPDAVFFLGETYLQRSRPREAAEQYLKLSTDYAKSSRAPEAMMRLGQSLALLGNTEQACATFAEVSHRYPAASPVVKKTVDREMQKDHC